MGRPKKYNLQYFPLNIDFWDDHKIISIEEAARIHTGDPKAGITAGYIALRILAMVYADQGYYLEWPDKFEMTVAKRIGNSITGAEVKQVFDLCLEHDLFNQEIFKKMAVVTSTGIQKRWRLVMSQLRRQIEPDPDLWLITSEETPKNTALRVVTSEETTTPATLSTQKESKVNEIKSKEAPKVAAPEPQKKIIDPKHADDHSEILPKQKRIAGAKFKPPTEQECIDYFTKKAYNPKNPGSWYPDRCQREGSDFFNFYTGNGWVQGKNKPIRSWPHAANMWISRAKSGEFSAPMNGHTSPAPAAKEKTIDKLRTKELPVMSRDINYLYERYKENPAMITTLSISVPDYDHLKASGKVKFDEQKKADIRTQALKELEPISKEPTEALLVASMKKIGVLEVFKQHLSEGKEIIFNN